MIIPDLVVKTFSTLLRLRPRGPIRFDDSLGDPLATKIRQAAVKNDWGEVERILDGTRDLDDRAFYLGQLGETGIDAPRADRWVEERGNAATPHLVRGLLRIHWAWKARGGGKGSEVSEDRGRLFLERLELAEKDLAIAIDGDGADPAPWWLLITSAMGLGLEMEEEVARFREAIRRDPGHRSTHIAMLNAVLEKWGGSHELSFQFAKDRAAAVAGGELAFLIPLAHIYRWEYALRFDENEQEARAYFKQSSVQRDIDAAWKLAFRSGGQRKARNAHFDHNVFAFCFWKMGGGPSARREFAAIGKVASTFPWSFGNVPARYFEAARKESGA